MQEWYLGWEKVCPHRGATAHSLVPSMFLCCMHLWLPGNKAVARSLQELTQATLHYKMTLHVYTYKCNVRVLLCYVLVLQF